MILEGTTSSGAVVPVQVTGDGKVVAEGLQGPQGPEGPEGPEGPPGPAGGYWERTGAVVSPINAGDTIATDDNAVQLVPGTTGSPLVRDSNGRLGVGESSPLQALHVAGNIYAASDVMTRNGGGIFFSGSGSYTTGVLSLSGSLVARTAGTERVRVSSNGVFTVGNGTTNAVTLDPGSTGSPLVRDSSGRLLVGAASNTLASSSVVIQGNPQDATQNPTLLFSRNRSIGTATGLGIVAFGKNDMVGAQVMALSNGTWTEGSSHPSMLQFHTTPSGSTTPVERMTIDSQGDVIFQGAPIIKSPDGKHWAIEVDNTGNLSAIEVL